MGTKLPGGEEITAASLWASAPLVLLVVRRPG